MLEMPDILSWLGLHTLSIFSFWKVSRNSLGFHVLKSQEDKGSSETLLSSVWTCSGALQSENSYLYPEWGELFQDLWRIFFLIFYLVYSSINVSHGINILDRVFIFLFFLPHSLPSFSLTIFNIYFNFYLCVLYVCVCVSPGCRCLRRLEEDDEYTHCRLSYSWLWVTPM